MVRRVIHLVVVVMVVAVVRLGGPGLTPGGFAAAAAPAAGTVSTVGALSCVMEEFLVMLRCYSH